jgi:hypothetical protein
MPAEPEKFHVSMIDFFSIILPGAVMTFYLRTLAERSTPPIDLVKFRREEGWVAFAIASYIIGHFLFLAGSFLDYAYDFFREKFWSKEKDFPRLTALKIKSASLLPCQIDDKAINAFQWAKCRLTLSYPAALAHVQRFEADSKFFRSLFVVLLILFVHFSVTMHPWFAFVSFAMAAAAVWRYSEQRFKCTRQAYWYLVALESIANKTITENGETKET